MSYLISARTRGGEIPPWQRHRRENKNGAASPFLASKRCLRLKEVRLGPALNASGLKGCAGVGYMALPPGTRRVAVDVTKDRARLRLDPRCRGPAPCGLCSRRASEVFQMSRSAFHARIGGRGSAVLTSHFLTQEHHYKVFQKPKIVVSRGSVGRGRRQLPVAARRSPEPPRLDDGRARRGSARDPRRSRRVLQG